MKTHLVLTEDWQEMKDAIPVAQKYLAIFGVTITSEQKTVDVTSEFLYNTELTESGLTKSEVKSLKPAYIFGLVSTEYSKADCIGIICDKAKAIEGTNLFGQQQTLGIKQIIEVYAVKKRAGTYGFTPIAYTLIHELFHALADFHQVEDTLHAYLSTNKKSLDNYKEELLSRIVKNKYGLLPLVYEKAQKLVAYAEKHALPIRINEGYRSPERQDQLYKQKTKVTNAKAWQSMHQYRVAFDIVFVQLGYNATNVQWNIISSYAKTLGLNWGGDWTGFVDRPHFELTCNKSLADFQHNNIDWSRYYETQHIFLTDLQYGMSHPDVKLLQQFLNKHGCQVAQTGPGSPGNETDYFGDLTKQALIKYQQLNNIAPAIGFFGPITREKVYSEISIT